MESIFASRARVEHSSGRLLDLLHVVQQNKLECLLLTEPPNKLECLSRANFYGSLIFVRNELCSGKLLALLLVVQKIS
jgi:hypothetical protein